MKIERFEDLVAWQEARKPVAAVYDLTKQPQFRTDHELLRQVRSSAISVMANIAEGFSRFTLKDSRQFFVIARSSLQELRSHSYAALDQGYLTAEIAEGLSEQMEIVGKLLTGLIRNNRAQFEKEQLSHSTIEPLSALQ